MYIFLIIILPDKTINSSTNADYPNGESGLITQDGFFEGFSESRQIFGCLNRQDIVNYL
jgi:hypothetical protein